MDTTDNPSRLGVVVWTSQHLGSELHAALKALNWFDKMGRSRTERIDKIGFPCLQDSALSLEQMDQLRAVFPYQFEQEVLIVRDVGPSVNPHDRLRRCVLSWIGHRGAVLPGKLGATLPSKWERLGDLIVLPIGAFQDDVWCERLEAASRSNRQELWRNVAAALGGARLARQAQIMNNALRSPQLEMLYGEHSWVEFSDHGVKFGFDAQHVMFSAGNVTERHRIGGMNMQGETVVDAYAGTGYYTLPMLVRSGALHVHACEMNPASIDGLQWGAEANNVANQLTVHQGDNQTTLPSLIGIADRCHLGLLPSSEAVWPHALNCLKPEGGRLHIHMNVGEEFIDEWCEETIDSLQHLSKELGRVWSIEAEHLERVKSYAPRVYHIVLDVKCSTA
ncbi:MAG: hypothetical protein QMC59_03070 [Candidatus Poseidoniaceae archaeon]